MKNFRQMTKLLALLTCFGANSVMAEDVDIFLSNATNTSSRPNVLLVLDNAASNNSQVTLLDGLTKGDKLEMLRQVLNNIVDPKNSPYFPACNGLTPRVPVGCVTTTEVSALLDNINLGLMIANPSG